ncbi:MAG: hypothetical protein C5B49_13745 [Bdellovibrio sp.]|nr:MAG: hypothetical protein C5B49_13745 [Bdellovibrio sp.]
MMLRILIAVGVLVVVVATLVPPLQAQVDGGGENSRKVAALAKAMEKMRAFLQRYGSRPDFEIEKIFALERIKGLFDPNDQTAFTALTVIVGSEPSTEEWLAIAAVAASAERQVHFFYPLDRANRPFKDPGSLFWRFIDQEVELNFERPWVIDGILALLRGPGLDRPAREMLHETWLSYLDSVVFQMADMIAADYPLTDLTNFLGAIHHRIEDLAEQPIILKPDAVMAREGRKTPLTLLAYQLLQVMKLAAIETEEFSNIYRTWSVGDLWQEFEVENGNQPYHRFLPQLFSTVEIIAGDGLIKLLRGSGALTQTDLAALAFVAASGVRNPDFFKQLKTIDPGRIPKPDAVFWKILTDNLAGKPPGHPAVWGIFRLLNAIHLEESNDQEFNRRLKIIERLLQAKIIRFFNLSDNTPVERLLASASEFLGYFRTILYKNKRLDQYQKRREITAWYKEIEPHIIEIRSARRGLESGLDVLRVIYNFTKSSRSSGFPLACGLIHDNDPLKLGLRLLRAKELNPWLH